MIDLLKQSKVELESFRWRVSEAENRVREPLQIVAIHGVGHPPLELTAYGTLLVIEARGVPVAHCGVLHRADDYPTGRVADAWKDCEQGEDRDLSIKGCTEFITKGDQTKQNLAVAYHNRGNGYGLKGEFDRAIADYTKAIELDPKYAHAYYGRGVAYGLKGEFDRAIADYTKAIEINPKDARYYNNRAWYYLKAGKAAQGLQDAEKSLELRPDEARTLGTRGQIFEALGRREEAIADYRRALSKDPSDQESKDGLKRLGASP